MLDFSSLKPHREVFVGPDGNKYILTSASIDAAIAFRNANLAAAVINADGKITRFSGMADSEPTLVGLCVYAGEDPKPDAQPVGIDFIRRWDSRCLGPLYDRIVEVSPGLVTKEKNPDPKEQPSNGGGN